MQSLGLSLDPWLAPLFADCEYPWEVLPDLADFLADHIEPEVAGEIHGMADVQKGQLFLGKGARVFSSACIEGPAYIGENSIVGHGVLLRGGVYIGDNSVVGNGSEVKNTAVMAGSNLSHMVGVFDAIIGRGVNVGGGAMFANSQLYGKAVKATLSDRRIDTDLQHFSTILADGVQLGANVVLGPGAILDRGSSVYPCTRFHGYAAEGEAVKTHSY